MAKPKIEVTPEADLPPVVETVGPYTAAEFFSLFTQAEVGAFYAQIDGGNVALRLVRDMIMATSTPLAVDNPLVTNGLAILVASGVITQARSDEIAGV